MNEVCLQSAIIDYDNNFIRYWENIFSSFSAYGGSDRVWFAGPSAYVFSLCGQKFAVDLQIRRQCDFEKIKSKLHDYTRDLSFVLITHEHGDHMCVPLMRELRDTDIKWYIPHDCSWHLVESSGVKEENIVRVKPGEVFKVGELTIKAFYSPHVKQEDNETFAQRGYEIICPDKHLLFPGDVRDYGFCDYPEFDEVDVCFSHVWGGNNSIDESLFMPMLQDFVKFNLAFKAKRYFLCHLYELGREAKKMWSYKHAGIAKDMFYSISPESVVDIPRLGGFCDL